MDKERDEELILNSLFNVNTRVLTIVSKDDQEYKFRVTKSHLQNTLFPNTKAYVDSEGKRWYRISQYHQSRIDTIDLYMCAADVSDVSNTEDYNFKLYYSITGDYEDVKDVYF